MKGPTPARPRPGRLGPVRAATFLFASACLLVGCTGGGGSGRSGVLEAREGGGDVVDLPFADGSLTLPAGWFGTSVQYPRGRYLSAATRAEAVDGRVEGCGLYDEGCSVRAIEPADLAGDDAFVEAWGVFGPPQPSGRQGPVAFLPAILVPSSFTAQGEHLSEPVFLFEGLGGDGGHYRVRYWVGPDAPEQRGAEALALLRRLELPAGPPS